MDSNILLPDGQTTSDGAIDNMGIGDMLYA